MNLLLCLCGLGIAAVATAANKEARDYAPDLWEIVGPYPNEVANGQRVGLNKDYLGGEPTVTIKGKKVKGRTVDFTTLYKETDSKVAYAVGTVKSDIDQSLTAYFGSDDGAKIWVNGNVVYEVNQNRGLVPEQDQFVVNLKKGENQILVKVENGSGGWGFALTIPNAAAQKERRHRQTIRNLGNYDISAMGPYGPSFLLTSPTFPTLTWSELALIDTFVSDEPLKVRWFDDQVNEVKSAEKPGVYLAYVEAKTIDGSLIRRILTFARPDAALMGWLQEGPGITTSIADAPEGSPVTKEVWSQAKPHIQEIVNNFVSERLGGTQAAAAVVAYLMGHAPTTSEPLSGATALAALQLKVKQKVYGVSPKPFHGPAKRATPAPVLRLGTAEEAQMKPETSEKLKAILEEWSKEEGKPFSALVARNGVVFLHDGFGGVTKDATFYPASIGKTLFGTVFAQFVDQGLVDPDEPLGNYLPDFPKTGPKAITFRNCLTHTSGLNGHYTFTGIWNPTLDNAFSLWLPDLEPGVRFSYGGDGNNLSSKALELIAGKPMEAILKDNLFNPLETKIVEPDLGFSSNATAWDIAKVAQVIANKGSYGDLQFFSEATWKKFLPTKLAPLMPRLQDNNLEWGYAIQYLPDPDGPRENGVLGPNVVGHGSASSSILRIDLDSGLVVVMGRYGIGNDAKYNEYRVKFMKALKECLAN